MYTRNKTYVRTNHISPDIFIKDQDYSNSELLYKLDRVYEYKDYTITKYEHRADLIAKDIYNDESYDWIILYINRIGIEDLVRGRVIKYIAPTTLTSIISAI